MNNKPFVCYLFPNIIDSAMILSKKVTLAGIVSAIIVVAILALQAISSSSTTISTSAKMSIQFTREEMKRVGFGVVERIAADKRESIVIGDDGKGFYILTQGSNNIQKEFSIDNDTLKRLRSLISDFGLLALNINKDSMDKDEFLRYTLSINIDGSSKTIRWVERFNMDEMEPADTPPLLIRVRDMLLNIMQSAS